MAGTTFLPTKPRNDRVHYTKQMKIYTDCRHPQSLKNMWHAKRHTDTLIAHRQNGNCTNTITYNGTSEMWYTETMTTNYWNALTILDLENLDVCYNTDLIRAHWNARTSEMQPLWKWVSRVPTKVMIIISWLSHENAIIRVLLGATANLVTEILGTAQRGSSNPLTTRVSCSMQWIVIKRYKIMQ